MSDHFYGSEGVLYILRLKKDKLVYLSTQNFKSTKYSRFCQVCVGHSTEDFALQFCKLVRYIIDYTGLFETCKYSLDKFKMKGSLELEKQNDFPYLSYYENKIYIMLCSISLKLNFIVSVN